MADKTDWVVDGFQFATEQDANLARSDISRIERLEEKLDYNNIEMINAVYKKALDNHVFKTPVGYVFLKKLQAVLRKAQTGGEKAADIPVQAVYSLRDSTAPVLERIRVSNEKPKAQKSLSEAALEKKTIALRMSMLINAALLIMVLLMFWISTTGSNPNILNYEHALQNKYSQWEQELSERENAVREKERELLTEGE